MTRMLVAFTVDDLDLVVEALDSTDTPASRDLVEHLRTLLRCGESEHCGCCVDRVETELGVTIREQAGL